MKIHSAYKYELDLNDKERTACLQYAGVARWAYNYGLARKQEARRLGIHVPSAMDLAKEVVRLKHSTHSWLQEVSKWVPAEALRCLDHAFERFFAGVSRYPRFKSRKNRVGNFRLQQDIRAEGRFVRLPSLGFLRTKEETKVEGRILSATVSERAGRWFVSLQVERDIAVTENQGPAVGVDLGITHLATLSDSQVIENPRHLDRRLRQIKRLQRRLARRKKGSGRYQTLKVRIARLHYRIACARSDTIHKFTTRLTREHGTIGIEDLNVKGMVRNHCLARALGDCSFGEIRRQIEYKTIWRGGRVVVHSRFFPSSKTCSGCGTLKAELPLSQRTFACEKCGLVLDRDVNAAKNLCPVANRVLDGEGKALAPAQAGSETGPDEPSTGLRNGE